MKFLLAALTALVLVLIPFTARAMVPTEKDLKEEARQYCESSCADPEVHFIGIFVAPDGHIACACSIWHEPDADPDDGDDDDTDADHTSSTG